MNRFVCRHCGMITDNPEIVPHPQEGERYRTLLKFAIKNNLLKGAEAIMEARFNYGLMCAVCLNETRFWRDEPFPTDDLHRTTLKEQMEYYLSSISAHLI